MHDRLKAAAKGKGELEGLKGRPVRYAIAYDGAIQDPDAEGNFEPALIVEYGEKGMTQAYSAYLLYQNPGSRGRRGTSGVGARYP